MTAKETERLAIVETRVTNIESTVTRIEAKIDGLDKKYASKTAERIVYGLIVAILLFVLNGWLNLFKIPSIQVVTPQPTSTSGTSGTSGTPSANASASAKSDSSKPSDSQTSQSGGLLDDVPLVNQVTK